MLDPSPTPGVSLAARDSAPGGTPAAVRFGLFELDLQSRELRKRGVKVSLPDQQYQVLRLLLEHPGDVVTRDELRRRLWPADTFVNFDLSLNSAVRKLREALGDSADHPAFVETLPRHGYRFIAPVERPRPADVTPPGAQPAPARPRRRGQLLWAIGTLVVAATAATLWIAWKRAEYPSPGPHIRSIAVLPFKNLTGDPAHEHVADTMTAGLIAELMKVGTVPVCSLTTSMPYKGTAKRLREIARELEVDAVVEGTAAVSEGKVQIGVMFIHAATDRPLWASSYERDAKAIPAIQETVARLIVRAVRSAAVAASLSASAPVPRKDAWDLYHQGIEAFGRNNVEGWRLAESYFEQAVEKQPDFAQAWGRLAHTRHQFLFAGPMAPNEVLPKAEEAARKALALDRTDEYALRSLRLTRRVYGDRAGADALSNRTHPGRSEDPVIAAERAGNYEQLAALLRKKGEGARAVEERKKALALEPSRSNYLFRVGAGYVALGEIKEGIRHLEEAVARSSQRNQRYVAYLGYSYARDGRLQEARQILQELLARREREYVSSFGIALLHDVLGDKTSALAALERAVPEHAYEFTVLGTYPPFMTLAKEPRYLELMRKWRADR